MGLIFIILLGNLPIQSKAQSDTNPESLVMKMQLDKGHEHIYVKDKKEYKVTDFTLNLTSNNSICPTNNCKFDFNKARFTPSMLGVGYYLLVGRLKVAETNSDDSIKSKFYEVFANLQLIEELEQNKKTVKNYEGSLSFNKNEFRYDIANATLVLENDNNNLMINAEITS